MPSNIDSKKKKKTSTHLHGGVIKLQPLAADVKDQRLAEKEMLVAEAGCHPAEVEEIGVLAVVFQRYAVGLGRPKQILRQKDW